MRNSLRNYLNTTLVALGSAGISLNLVGCLAPSISNTETAVSSSTSSSSSSTLAAPSQLVVSAITGPSITLTWTDNATTETGYTVQFCTGANCTGFAAVSASPLAASSTTHTEAGLANGTVYRFRIRAVTASLNSNWLTSGNLTTPGVPNAPAGVTPTYGQTGVTLTWTAVSGATSYDIEQCLASACVYAAVTGSPLAAPAVTIDMIDLAASTGYIFRVRANNAVGAGSYTTTPTVTTLGAMTAAVTASAASSIAATTMTFSWSGGATGSVGYLLEQCTPTCAGVCNAAITVAQANPATTSYAVTGLTTNTAYCFKVTSFQGPDTSDRNGAYSSAVITTAATPADPTLQVVTTTTDTTVILNWTDGVTPAPVSYDIETIASSTCSSFSGATTTNVLQGVGTKTLTDLTPNTAYCIRMRSKNATAYGSYVSFAGTPSTTTLTVPTTPAELYVSSISATGIELKWQDMSSDEDRWELARCDAASSSASCTIFNILTAASGGCDSTNAMKLQQANVTRCLDTSATTAGMYYYYRVRAVDTMTVDRESSWITLSNPVTPKADVVPIGTGKSDGTGGIVYAMARAGDAVYLGGDFDYAGPVSGPAARMSTGSTTVTLGNIVFKDTGTTAPSINAIISDGASGYYVGGHFTHANASARTSLIHVLADGSLDTLWTSANGGLDAAGTVHALALVGNYLVVGGDFATLGGLARVNLGSIYVGTSTPVADADWNPDPNGIVYTIAASGTGVYIGGAFTMVSATARVRLAHLSAVFGNGGASEFLSTFCDGLAGATGGNVKTIALNSTNLVVGGLFTTVNGTARNFIAEVSSACALTSWNPSVTGTDVKAMVVSGSSLYVGGNFTMLSTSARTDFGALNLNVTANYVGSLNPAQIGRAHV